MEINAHLKRQIKDELARRGMTQKQFAEQLDMSQGALGNVLAGDRALLTVNAMRVLDALDLELVVQLRR